MSFPKYVAAQVVRILPRVGLSKAVGKLCEIELPSTISKVVTSTFAKAYDIQMAEAVGDHGGFEDFDAFFTRRLQPGSRPLADGVILSPADGNIVAAGFVDGAAGVIPVKGQRYNVAELLGSAEDADRYKDGHYSVCYLSPQDYHRVHSPIAGKLTEIRGIPGDLFPVNSLGEKYVPNLFVRNKRAVFVIDTETHGRVTVVMVGATIVGRISSHTVPGVPHLLGNYTPNVALARGEELGIFHLGSTTVTFTEKCLPLSTTLGKICMGRNLGGT